MEKQSAPLEGIRVLELGHIVAGPSAGVILSELGAQVVKVEHPKTGDTGRNMPNKGSTFYFLNRNKKSIAIDFKCKEGPEIFKRLIEKYDVVVDNYAPGALDRLGIGYSWAKKINPRIIYCSIKGFLNGPKQNRPSLDELAQMEGGLAYMTGPPGQPMRAGASIVDIGAATYGVLGILSAVIQREKTGIGEMVSSGLYETTVFWVGQHISKSQMFENEAVESLTLKGMGMLMGWGVYQLFPTKDERQIFIAVTTNRHWEKLCQALGMNDLFENPDYDNNRKRVYHKAYIAGRITEIVQQYESQKLCELLEQEGVPFASVNSPGDLVNDPQVAEHMLNLEVPGKKELKVPTLPVRFGNLKYELRSMPPRLGEHTREILRESGFSDSEILELLNNQVIRENGPMIRVDEDKRRLQNDNS